MPGLVRVGVDLGEGEEDDDCVPCPYASGSATVFINGFPAVRAGDPLTCDGNAVGSSSNINIDGLPAHRQGDATTCGTALSGSGNVNGN